MINSARRGRGSILRTVAWIIFALCLVVVAPGVFFTIRTVYWEQLQRRPYEPLRGMTEQARVASSALILVAATGAAIYFLVAGYLSAAVVLLAFAGQAALNRLGR